VLKVKMVQCAGLPASLASDLAVGGWKDATETRAFPHPNGKPRPFLFLGTILWLLVR
jgi:hypothetical protein